MCELKDLVFLAEFLNVPSFYALKSANGRSRSALRCRTNLANDDKRMFDVAVIGAGAAGLICAQQLQRSGYRVVVLEKSRGLGGRMATRRLEGTWADHGLRSLEVQGNLTQQLIQILCDRQIIHPWTNAVYVAQGNSLILSQANSAPRYASANGITAVAKFLATGLEIRRGQRVTAIAPQPGVGWSFTLDPVSEAIDPPCAKAVVLAIPAPQALALLEPLAAAGLSTEMLDSLRSVQFDPCITAIAAYAKFPDQLHSKQNQLTANPLRAVTYPGHPVLDWVGLESSKGAIAAGTDISAIVPFTVVIQSSAGFATHYLDAIDLSTVARQLLQAAAQALGDWITQPDVLQVHRWRYAFVQSPHSETCSEPCLMTTTPFPIACSGDWCHGKQLENALASGLETAQQIDRLLQKATAPLSDFSDLLKLLGNATAPEPRL